METLTETIEKIKQTAQENNNRPKQKKVRTVTNLKTGECYRQGDLYVFKVDDNHPVGKELDRRQLADGASIGQRHMLTGSFVVYEGKQAPAEISELHVRAGLGYAFDVLAKSTMNIHPEHDNFLFEQTGRFQVMHQVDRRTLRRVAD